MLRDIWLIFRRDSGAALRNPAWLLIGVLQPLLYLFFFGPLPVKTPNAQGLSDVDGWMVLTLASCSYPLALTLKSEESFTALLNAVLMPLLLLSGILIPITAGLAPKWLYTISQINPARHVVDVERTSFRGDFSMDALFTGSVVVLAMAVLAIWWGAHTFQRENA
ncbi:ABC transporter permease [Amycolatopsis jiangsuensis]|uniref:ABC transporter permease n=1 Tax=Amycolatopsis jiangsuensis TaxID=1181879 RepID=UPI003642B144